MAAVVDAFTWIASGAHSQREVLSKLRARGVNTRRGNPLTAQTLNKLLRNPLYKGRVVVPKWKTDDPGDFEPLVSEELWNAAQAVMDGRSPALVPHARNNADFPLRKFVWCDHCGTPLTGGNAKGRSKTYSKYWCRNSKCSESSTIPAETLEAQFVELLQDLRPKREYLKLFHAIVLDVWKQRGEDTTKQRKALQAQIDKLSGQKQKLLDAFLYREALDQQTYEAERQRLDARLGEVRLALSEVTTDELDVEQVLGFAEHLVLHADKVWRQAGLEQRQRFQQLLFPQGIAHDGQRFTLNHEISCAFRWLGDLQSEKSNLASPRGFEPLSPP